MFICITFIFLHHCVFIYWFWLILSQFGRFLSVFFKRSFHCADHKGDSSGRTMYQLGFIVITLMFLKLREGGEGVNNGPPPLPQRSGTQKRPRLNRVKRDLQRLSSICFYFKFFSMFFIVWISFLELQVSWAASCLALISSLSNDWLISLVLCFLAAFFEALFCFFIFTSYMERRFSS